jgi:hypothetical protein
MSDFERLRDPLQRARDAAGSAAAEAAAAVDAERRLREQLREAQRSGRRERVAQLQATLVQAQEHSVAQRAARQRLLADEMRLHAELAVLADPQQGAERLDPALPVLMLPLRLETRFKHVDAQHELWLRIYPDDCWIDGFTPTLTESEARDSTTYWAGVWQAGGQQSEQRAAWQALVSGHGAGRASWIVQQRSPDNAADEPVKAKLEDVVLVSVVDAALPAAEASALSAFWTASWRAANGAELTAAAAALTAAVGSARSSELQRTTRPVNFDAPVATGFGKADVAVQHAQLVLPAVPTRQAAWTDAPKVRLLPERFVFIGYRQPGDDQPLVQLGGAVPSSLWVAPDPSAPADQQIHHDDNGDLVVPEELRWLHDFERAVELGMGMRIPLSPDLAASGFSRVLVLGLRLGADAEQSALDLQTLLQHQAFSGSGIALLRQGTPTNNTDAVTAGYGRLDDADSHFELQQAPAFTITGDWRDKRDGQWLAEYLGLDPAVLQRLPGAGGTDLRAARAMNRALWPATLGYWMESMLAPIFDAETIEHTRDYFCRHVVAGGACPTVRIGWQPYGILATTALSRMEWLGPKAQRDRRLGTAADFARLQKLQALLVAIEHDTQPLVARIAHVGGSGDPHALLLDVIGLHPGSVEWTQRYAESFKTLFNRLNLQGLAGLISALLLNAQRAAASGLLSRFGAAAGAPAPILDLVFSGRHQLIKGGVVDDVPLSETAPIRAYATNGDNYLQWLLAAARSSLDALYRQQGFINGRAPAALLYLLLRHALQLGYHDVSVRLHRDAGLMTAEQALRARQDEPLLHVRQHEGVSESRYQPLYASVAAITGDVQVPVHRFIARELHALLPALGLREQLAALERLVDEPTARLERALADHLDLCSHRLDAWRLGMVDLQLTALRGFDIANAAPRRGIQLGAYAWLEDLRPEARRRSPVVLDPDLAEHFGDASVLERNSANQGHVLAPSLNHAVAAAVLRNGYLSNARAAQAQTLAVNLSSERVRTALALLEGIRGGQSLADLLGYQLERGLHDSHGLAEVDRFIFRLRKAFPLRADRLRSTRTDPGVPIEAIEARNVINGLALVEQVQASGSRTYPFGRSDLPTATAAEMQALNAEVDRLLQAHDAVADLALAEGVYQAVLGNYDRVASTYEAYARGNFPPEPEVVRTPLSGAMLTHRLALHLDPTADPAVSPVGGTPSPRGRLEPAINHALAQWLPDPATVGCMVDYRHAATGSARSSEVTLAHLGLEPADMLALVNDQDEQAMGEFDDRIVLHAMQTLGPRPDVAVTIRYRDTQAAACSVVELMPLTRALRRLIGSSRPLEATDLSLANEASVSQDSGPEVNAARLTALRTTLNTLRGDVDAFISALQPLLDDLPSRADDLVDAIDTNIDTLVALLERAARFSMPQAGWGFAYQFREGQYGGILQRVTQLVARWTAKAQEYDDSLAAAAAAGSDSERMSALAQADAAIAVLPVDPAPATPAAYLAFLLGTLRPAFDARLAQFNALLDSTRTALHPLIGDVEALLPVTDIDAAAFDLTEERAAIVAFGDDMQRAARAVLGEVDRRLQRSGDALTAATAATPGRARVEALQNAAKALLGEQAKLLPSFALGSVQGSEVAQALAASRTPAPFQHLTQPADPAEALDFPVDTWLYGVARVRDKVNAWEALTMYAGALGGTEPELDALQFPYAPGAAWLGLQFPPDQAPDGDRLLYSAHFASVFDATQRQCGLLIDEWTETLPAATVDTGVTFHYDRPNSEAPQAWLLVTPPRMQGAWQWADLVDALNDTLDLAKRRAIEPRHLDATPYAVLSPATVVATQAAQLTIALDLALANSVVLRTES